MNYQSANCFVQGLLFFITWGLPLATSSIFYKKKELWPYFRIKCDRDCRYGYETDVEGIPIPCKCHDPCKNILCLHGTKCVIDLLKNCQWEFCKPKARCKDVDTKTKKERRKSSIYTTPFADDATTTASRAARREVCLLPLTEEAKDCKKLRKRWYFDQESGKCRKFRGCKTGGNNFGRKKRCKRKCMRKRRGSKRKGRRAFRRRSRQ